MRGRGRAAITGYPYRDRLTSKTFYKRRQALRQQATVAESTERFIKI